MSEQTMIAFIAVTGKPTKEQLVKMMKGYKDVGINDVMIYPRTGLEVEYMSEGWHNLVKIFIDYAKQNDMRVWLYDELNWPSGTCNHQVYYQNCDYYNRRFFIENGEVKVYQYVFKFNKNDWPFTSETEELMKYYKSHDEYNFRRELDPYTGKVIKELQFDEYNDLSESGDRIKAGIVDLLNPEAMKCFIDLTHEKYYKWFGEDFGSIIPGIFTDEPSYRHGIAGNDPRTQYCYYDGITDDYKKEYGSDMIEDMLAYEYHKPDNGFYANYTKLVGKRFKYSFMDTIHDWCDKHNLKYTGHMVKDDSATESVEFSGEITKTLKGFHIPGVDEIYTRMSYKLPFLGLPATNGATSDFLFSQLENQRRNGKDEAMVEMYALGPYNMSIAQRARGVYYASCFSINTYFMAMGHLDAKGNFNRSEYFLNSSYACIDSDNLKELAAAAKKARKIASKIPDARISIRYPYSAISENFGRPNVVDYDFLMKDIIQLLGENQYQWRLIAEEEDSKTNLTVGFGKNGIIDENTGKIYNDAASWYNDIKAKLDRNVTVTEMSGVLASDVFVREFTDGSYVVINRADDPGTARKVIVDVKGEKTIIDLFDYGVYTGEKQVKISRDNELIANDVSVSLDGNKRLFRCKFFGNHSFSFAANSDIKVKLHICTYPEKRDVYLDGEKIEYNEPETLFTDCYNPLYTVSKEIELEKGGHVLSIHEFDRNFLPMIIMEGDIVGYVDYDNDGRAFDVITNAPEVINPEEKTEFFGTASLNFSVDIPAGGANAEIDDFLGLCEFIVNGESLGKKAAAPYIFELGEKFAGKTVQCEIKYYSSYGAMYGDIEEIEKTVRTRSDWVRLSPASSRKETVSMNGLRIFAK